MISEETVERVREAADIVQIISETVKLKRTGSAFRGPCPFHQGKGPNFSVVPSKGIYHCFVCHESGDVFTFLKKKLGMDFSAAVKYVGERSGIEVIDTPNRPKVADPNEKHWEVLSSAAQWFRAQLQEPTVGREALRYLTERGLDAAAIERFELGYAPRDEQLLRKHLHSLGFDDSRQIDAGILKPAADGREARINFRDRVMFPIVDERGNSVGFGGRALGDAIPKYLNSAASDVYQKGRTLYGLHAARHAIRREGSAIVVEGYMDAIRVALAGFETVVAPLGTALTEEQAALLVRYASDVFLLYDSDKAGLEATFRSGLELLRHGASVRVVTLPEGDDPDTFTRAHGRAGLEAQLAQAIDVFDRQIQILERRGYFRDIGKSRSAVDLLIPTIRAAKDPLTKDLYITRLAEITHLDKAVIANEAEQRPLSDGRAKLRRSDGSAESNNHGDPGPAPADQSAPSPPVQESRFIRTPNGKWKRRDSTSFGDQWRTSAERPRGKLKSPIEHALLVAMVRDRANVAKVAARRLPEGFRDEHYRAIFGVLLMMGSGTGWEQIIERLEDPDANALAEMLNREEGQDAGSIDVEFNLDKLDAKDIDRKLAELRREIQLASGEQVFELQLQEQQLAKDRIELQPVRSPAGKPRY